MLPALVLTAGLGTRLDPITRLVAKPAVPLGDRTLVEHVLAWLERGGVRDVVMNLHHRPESIAAIAGDGAHLGLSVRYSWEHPVLGSAGAPRRALPLLGSDRFLIVNGDTLCDFDLASLRRAHDASGADVTMAVIPNSNKARYNGIRVGSANEVLAFVPKGHTEDTWHFVGVQVAAASVFADLPDGVPSETVAGLYRDLVARQQGRIRVFPVSTSFVDVGTPADYLAAALAVGTPPPGHARARRSVVDALSRTVVWTSARCAPDVRLRNCIVAGDVTLPMGFEAENAVIVPVSIVRAADAVEHRGGAALFPLG